METPMEIFKSEDGKIQVNVIIENETAWLTQAAMAELFGVQKAAVSKHLKNIFESGELQEKVVVSKMETTTRHGAIECQWSLTPWIFWGRALQSSMETGF